MADDDLTDYENIPLSVEIDDYMAEEVLPHAHDAYVDETYRDTLQRPDETGSTDGGVGIVGYEINFNRYFYEHPEPRELGEIDDELKAVEGRIAAMLAEVTE